MKKIRIIQTPVRFYPAIGGVENHVLHIAVELARDNYEVEVVCANEPNSLLSEYKNIKINRLFWLFKITNTNIALSLPFTLLFKSFDIVHTHMPTPWFADWSVLIAKLRRKKSIITIHNDIQKSGFFAKLITDIYLNTIFSLTLRFVDRIIIVNPNWRVAFQYTNKILLHYESKIVSIPNGVDIDLFRQKRELPLKSNSEVLFVSILDKHHKFKGLEYLIESMVDVVSNIPNVKLTIVGAGELVDVYKQLVIDKNLKNNIVFVGEKKNDELVEFYSHADLFVLPSIDTEGFGLVLLEALASGVPVITTPMAGISKEIDLYKVGVVVPVKDCKKLSEVIIKLLNNNEMRNQMSVNAIDMIKNLYDWKIIIKRLKVIYSELYYESGHIL